VAGLPCLVTGGSSPLGDVVLPRLIEDGAHVSCIVRSSEAAGRVRSHGAHVIESDLESFEAPPGFAASRVIHLAGIALGSTALSIAQDVGASHLVAISSASATMPGHPNRSWILESEQALASADIAVSVLRPTMIYGSARDRNVRRLTQLLLRLPRVPRFTGGGAIMPVLADDVASAILEASGTALAGTYAVGGGDAITLGELVDVIASLCELPRVEVKVPLRPLVGMAGLLPSSAGKGVHALQMLVHDRIVPTPAQEGFHFVSTPVADGVRLALTRYALDGATPSSA
jgi:uncharacterized protein YbjT (DUF2867 family)